MSKNFICPFCNSTVSITYSTQTETQCSFGSSIRKGSPFLGNVFTVVHNLCPTCDEVTIKAFGQFNLEGINIPLYPRSLAKQFPEYIPKAITEDYEEAYSILSLSPKASAALSRRCLQGMIRDFWEIKVKSGTLYDEINEIKDKVTSSQWKAIDALRSIGNIGAHMQQDVNVIVDIDDKEAEKLLKLIESLIEKWYINRYEENQLLSDIVDIKEIKKTPK